MSVIAPVRSIRLALLAGAVAIAAPGMAPAQASAPLPAVDGRALMQQYCVGCHNDRTRTAGLSLETLDPLDPAHDVSAFEKVILKLRVGMMPPEGRPRPDAAALAAFVADLEVRIDRAAEVAPRPGRPILHRLNRTEYANAVREFDHSLVLYGSPMCDGRVHTPLRVPLFLAGRANGQLRGNHHLLCPDGTPMANALLTVLRLLGVDIDAVGDSTGELDL